MAERCQQCGGPLLFDIGETVEVPGGRTIVCQACAERLRSREEPSAAAQPPRVSAGPADVVAPAAAGLAGSSTANAGLGCAALALGGLLLIAIAGTGVWLSTVGGAPHGDAVPTGLSASAASAVPVETEAESTPREPTEQDRADAWQGPGEFTCEAGQVVTLRGKKAAGRPLSVRANGDCRLTVVDCELSGAPSVDVRDTAQVTVQRSQLGVAEDDRGVPAMFRGMSEVVRVWTGASATLESTTIRGGRIGIRVDAGAHLTLVDATLRGIPGGEAGHGLGPAGVDVSSDAEVVVVGSTIEWSRRAIGAEGTALVAIRDSTLTATALLGAKQETAALYLEDGAQALVVGGTLAGPEIAIAADDSTTATLEGVTLVGREETAVNGAVERRPAAGNAGLGAPELLATLRAASAERIAEYSRIQGYQREACAGVIECMKDAGFTGPIDGRVTTPFDAAGNPGTTTLVGVPPAAAACVREVERSRHLPGFSGPPGKLVCRFSGQLMAGAQILSMGSSYVKAK